ncbi:hypothetical protein HPP92_001013 [Vanilla planifolia]|uniref:Uncharacterized protein n=1 Tax=Vanilla planifolia TaxID=51239 RepID=A0A835S3D3_VANPL|nr:hypothetical protein HPP92_001013 [Vanilla planifolia]
MASLSLMKALPPSAPTHPSLSRRRFNFHKAIAASASEDVPSTRESEASERVKLAFAKARAYKKARMSATPQVPVTDQKPSTESADEGQSGDGLDLVVPERVKLAMQKAKEYKKNKEAAVAGPSDVSEGQDDIPLKNFEKSLVDDKLNNIDDPKISSKDFLGLDFSEKKSYRGMPPGLIPLEESLCFGEMPEVEIIVGDASKFGSTLPSTSALSEVNDCNGLFKPKVTTWGASPRPENISKTFGGGRVIQPGDALESAEEKEAKEKQSRELIAAYKEKMGLIVDAKTSAECEKSLKEGDSLMDKGLLIEALPYFEKVMNSVIFQSELHGFAALHWSICQDSLNRPKEARVMYEKLSFHPNFDVSKKAKMFAFSFKAMEMLKVKSSYISRTTGYEHLFNALQENSVIYIASVEDKNEAILEQAFPYLVFLLSPILIVFLAVARKLL